MHEIEQLEKDWRRYKRKQRIPFIVGAFIILIVASGAIFWPLQNKTNQRPAVIAVTNPSSNVVSTVQNPEKNKTSMRKSTIALTEKTTHGQHVPSDERPKNTNPATKKPLQTTEIKNEHTVILDPDTAFLSGFGEAESRPQKHMKRHTNTNLSKPIHEETIKATSFDTTRKYQRTSQTLEKHRNNGNQEKSVLQRDETRPVSSEDTTTKKSTLSIQTKQANNTLKYLIERFNQTRDPKLAVYIAQSFYNKNEYEKTIKWSVIANSIEPSNEVSWLLFAKAKVKLGQKMDAINALQIYLNQYSSRKVKNYLKSLEGDL